jgi:hypothetical protein
MASENHCIWTRTCPRHSWFLEHLGIRTRLRTTLALHPCFCGSLCFNDLHCQEKKTENAASLTQPKSVSEPKIKAVLDKRGLVGRAGFEPATLRFLHVRLVAEQHPPTGRHLQRLRPPVICWLARKLYQAELPPDRKP